jgi:hypothetical protein
LRSAFPTGTFRFFYLWILKTIISECIFCCSLITAITIDPIAPKESGDAMEVSTSLDWPAAEQNIAPPVVSPKIPCKKSADLHPRQGNLQQWNIFTGLNQTSHYYTK